MRLAFRHRLKAFVSLQTDPYIRSLRELYIPVVADVGSMSYYRATAIQGSLALSLPRQELANSRRDLCSLTGRTCLGEGCSEFFPPDRTDPLKFCRMYSDSCKCGASAHYG